MKWIKQLLLVSSYLEPIPKMADRHIVEGFFPYNCLIDQSNIFHQLKKFQMNYGMKLKIILPPKKANNTTGRPVISIQKVLDGILYILRTGCQWKMLPKEYGSGSTCHRRFQQ